MQLRINNALRQFLYATRYSFQQPPVCRNNTYIWLVAMPLSTAKTLREFIICFLTE